MSKILYRLFVSGAIVTLLFVILQICDILSYLEQNTAQTEKPNGRIRKLEFVHRENLEEQQEKFESLVEIPANKSIQK